MAFNSRDGERREEGEADQGRDDQFGEDEEPEGVEERGAAAESGDGSQEPRCEGECRGEEEVPSEGVENPFHGGTRAEGILN